MTTFTTADVNTWFQTIDGLPIGTPSISSSIATSLVDELNAGTETPVEVQAILENFPFNPAPPPTNIPTSEFFRTRVADFVLREFQAAWGVVPTSGGAGSQYDLWVSRVIADPTLQTTGAMSQALAGTPQFMTLYATNSATEPATLAVVTQMCESLLGIPPGPGALLNVGLPVWQVLQNFVTSPVVIARMDAPIANFQNLLLAGETPTGSIFALPGTGGTTFTLTSGVDSPTAGFTTGHGATAIAAGSVFEALPSSNPPLGVTNTLQAGDDLEATGAAAGASQLNYLAVNSLINGPLAVAVKMNGINLLNITNSSTGTAGFSGNITGLTTVVASTATPGSPIVLGAAGLGLNTALTDITLTSNFGTGAGFTAWMTAAALGGATDAATVHLPGVTATAHLNVTTGGNGYETLTVDSGGIATPNVLHLDTNAISTATIIVTGAQNLTIDGTALNIANLHTFTGTAAAGPWTCFSSGVGHVAATGGSAERHFQLRVCRWGGNLLGLQCRWRWVVQTTRW